MQVGIGIDRYKIPSCWNNFIIIIITIIIVIITNDLFQFGL